MSIHCMLQQIRFPRRTLFPWLTDHYSNVGQQSEHGTWISFRIQLTLSCDSRAHKLYYTMVFLHNRKSVFVKLITDKLIMYSVFLISQCLCILSKLYLYTLLNFSITAHIEVCSTKGTVNALLYMDIWKGE